ncbi:cytochrome c oxidase assembly protein COX19-like [Hibiscus syriacus]|uniref:Cytochrome c oxidase assembly protein COX19-like n=1 Tax=Hibiscus syriacus TaxID=106335 RepID=A0A6A2W892_HIBSY|nr:cytochrome c oxidase assembly protein COX19-like [Hibiscus syriacus]
MPFKLKYKTLNPTMTEITSHWFEGSATLQTIQGSCSTSTRCSWNPPKGRPDTQRIFVDVGLGFHVEFTWSEALKFISLREEKLERQIEEYTRLIASIKAQIKLVCEGIRELLQIPEEKTVEGRVF